jgi:hypothetical protein
MRGRGETYPSVHHAGHLPLPPSRALGRAGQQGKESRGQQHLRLVQSSSATRLKIVTGDLIDREDGVCTYTCLPRLLPLVMGSAGH